MQTPTRPAPAAPSASAPKEPPVRISASHSFLEWLASQNVSLGFTTYQSCRLFLIGLKNQGKQLSVLERRYDRAMGLYATPDELWLATKYQLWNFRNVLAPGEHYTGYDRLYVPRAGHTTGAIDTHDVAVDRDGRVVFLSTLYSCLATVSDTHSFKALWKPPYISKLAPEDRCHLNGMAMDDGRVRFVTSVSRSDVHHGWRDRRGQGGVLVDVESGEVVCASLSMPHSPRVYRGDVWVLNSGTGELGRVDIKTGKFEPVVFLPGYVRGIAFHGDYAIVGLSKCRQNRTFSGLELDERLKAKDTEARCGLWIVDLRTGEVAEWMELQGVVAELYDVVAIPGVRRPTALGFKTNEIARIVSVEDGATGARSAIELLHGDEAENPKPRSRTAGPQPA